MNIIQSTGRNLVVPVLIALACITSASATSTHLPAYAAAPDTAFDTPQPIRCEPGFEPAGLGGQARSESARRRLLASATDITYCRRQCTPDYGCETVCRHLVW